MKHEPQSYQERFPTGAAVRVVDRSELERFAAEWKWHHPVQSEQFSFAGATTVVATVGFYHGGDVLYELKDMPGIWHEQCLVPA
jgi:hypothetical protein